MLVPPEQTLGQHPF